MIKRTSGAPRAFWYEMVAILAAKATALTILYLLFFASPPRIPPLGDHLLQQERAQ